MRFFIAGLDTETNTFSPIPTGRENFEEGLLAFGDATSRPLNYCSEQLDVWRRLGQSRGWTPVESVCAVAEPGGVTDRKFYEFIRARILSDLRTAGPIGFIILALHGAMVAEGYDDVEGDLISHIRGQVGTGVPIGVELDLHCHLTDLMSQNADAIVLYKEYPHTDIGERAAELFQIIADAAQRRTAPVTATFDCRMIGSFRTQEQPLRDFVDRMKALEGKNDILSISLGHGFPWGDVPDVGVKILVVADRDAGKARRLAERLGREVYAMRHALTPRFLSIDEALDRVAATSSGPIILADVSDNAGVGAPSDSTFIVKRILERGFRSVLSALHWDPMAVRFCRAAGENATLNLRIGGKTGPGSGTPLDLRVTVRRIVSGVTQRFGGATLSIGDAVWLQSDGIDLILNTQRIQVFHPECMTQLGVDIAKYHVLVVKSMNHFYAAFAPLASEVLFVDAPGTVQQRFADIPYTKLVRPFFPKVDDPFAI